MVSVRRGTKLVERLRPHPGHIVDTASTKGSQVLEGGRSEVKAGNITASAAVSDSDLDGLTPIYKFSGKHQISICT